MAEAILSASSAAAWARKSLVDTSVPEIDDTIILNNDQAAVAVVAGIADGQRAGTMRKVVNRGTQTITLAQQDTASPAADRFSTAAIDIPAKGAIMLFYTGTRWEAFTYAGQRSINLDIRDFGAKLTGLVDDGPAILAACNQALASGGGKSGHEVFLPAGDIAIWSQIWPAGNAGEIVIRGAGGATRLRPVMAGLDSMFRFANLMGITLEKFAVIGQDNGNTSTAARECYEDLIYVDEVAMANIRNVGFYGLYSEAGAIVCVNGTQAHLADVTFSGCTGPQKGVVRIREKSRGFKLDNFFFNDFNSFGPIYYDKLSVAANTKSWVFCDALDELRTAFNAGIEISNGRMDENTASALINLTAGNAGAARQRGLEIRNVRLHTGFGGGGRGIIAKNFRNVECKNVTAAYSGSAVEHEAAEFSNCVRVFLTNWQNAYGAKYISLTNGTGRLTPKNCNFNEAGGAHAGTGGINNAAAATIDAD